MQRAHVLRPGAAEFPHQNPRLDFGALWLFEPEEPPEVEAVAAPETSEPVVVNAPVAASEPVGAIAEPRPAPAETPITHQRVSTFLRAAVEVAIAHGGGEQAPKLALLLGERSSELLPAHAFSERASADLVEGKILERTEEGLHETTDFARQRDAWLGALRGDAQDLSCCGESTLDTFTANVVSRFLAKPDKREAVRRDLRRRGVAAFGML